MSKNPKPAKNGGARNLTELKRGESGVLDRLDLPEDEARAAQAGFDDYLVKPVDPTVLSQFLRSLQ